MEASVIAAADGFGSVCGRVLCSICCVLTVTNPAGAVRAKGGDDQMGQKASTVRYCIFKPQHSWVVSSDALCLL